MPSSRRHDAWSILTQTLADRAWVWIVLGIVTLVGVWFVGDTRRAAQARGAAAPVLESRPATYALAAVALLVVALVAPPIARGWLTALVLIALVVVGVEVVRISPFGKSRSSTERRPRPRRRRNDVPCARHALHRRRRGTDEPDRVSAPRPPRPSSSRRSRTEASGRATSLAGSPGSCPGRSGPSTSRSTTSASRRTPARSCSPGCSPRFARRPGSPPLQRRSPGPDRFRPRRRRARRDRGAAGGDARHRGRPRPHAPQVRRPRRASVWTGSTKLDGRLLVAAGERHRHARRARDRLRVLARLRAAVDERDGRAHGRRRAAPAGRRRRAGSRLVLPRVRSRCRTGSRSTSARRGSASGSRPRCSPPGRSWGRSSRSCRRVAATSPASSTTRRSTRCSTSGARTGVSEWKIRSSHGDRGRALERQGLDPVDAGVGARLHAREGRRRRRTSFVGSFNLSRSGERNAENVVEIRTQASPTAWPRTSTKSCALSPRDRSGSGGRGRLCRPPPRFHFVGLCSCARSARRMGRRRRVQVDVVPARVVEDRLERGRRAATTFVRLPTPSASAGSLVPESTTMPPFVPSHPGGRGGRRSSPNSGTRS